MTPGARRALLAGAEASAIGGFLYGDLLHWPYALVTAVATGFLVTLWTAYQADLEGPPEKTP